MTLLPLCHDIDEEGNRSRCWDTDKVRKDIVLDTQIFPWNIPVCPSPFKSNQKLVSVGGADYFSLKSNCIFSPPPSAIKETNVIATRRIWPFFISSSSSHSKNECPNFQGRNTKNGNPLWLEKNSTSLEKKRQTWFFEASMMCLLWSSPNTPFLRSTGRSKVVPNKTPDTNTRTPQYEQQNNIKWYQVGQGMARTCRMAVLATRMPPRRLRRGYAGTRTRIWN